MELSPLDSFCQFSLFDYKPSLLKDSSGTSHIVCGIRGSCLFKVNVRAQLEFEGTYFNVRNPAHLPLHHRKTPSFDLIKRYSEICDLDGLEIALFSKLEHFNSILLRCVFFFFFLFCVIVINTQESDHYNIDICSFFFIFCLIKYCTNMGQGD